MSEETCANGTHRWKRTGMFLIKIVSLPIGRGDVLRRIPVGGMEGDRHLQTPEVEICECCGILRMRVDEFGRLT